MFLLLFFQVKYLKASYTTVFFVVVVVAGHLNCSSSHATQGGSRELRINQKKVKPLSSAAPQSSF